MAIITFTLHKLLKNKNCYCILQILNVFKHDADYEENEQKYGAIKSELLGDDSGNYNSKCKLKCEGKSQHSGDLNLLFVAE